MAASLLSRAMASFLAIVFFALTASIFAADLPPAEAIRVPTPAYGRYLDVIKETRQQLAAGILIVSIPSPPNSGRARSASTVAPGSFPPTTVFLATCRTRNRLRRSALRFSKNGLRSARKALPPGSRWRARSRVTPGRLAAAAPATRFPMRGGNFSASGWTRRA